MTNNYNKQFSAGGYTLPYVYRFLGGGFVAHKISGIWQGKVSAWFNTDGVLTMAEQILPNGRIRSVKRYGPMWITIQSRSETLRRYLT